MFYYLHVQTSWSDTLFKITLSKLFSIKAKQKFKSYPIPFRFYQPKKLNLTSSIIHLSSQKSFSTPEIKNISIAFIQEWTLTIGKLSCTTGLRFYKYGLNLFKTLKVTYFLFWSTPILLNWRQSYRDPSPNGEFSLLLFYRLHIDRLTTFGWIRVKWKLLKSMFWKLGKSTEKWLEQ